jgi:hypothetical protein
MSSVSRVGYGRSWAAGTDRGIGAALQAPVLAGTLLGLLAVTESIAR